MKIIKIRKLRNAQLVAVVEASFWLPEEKRLCARG